MPYLIIYYERGLQMTDYVFIMAPAIVLAGVFTALWGRFYDRWKFNKSIIPSIALLILGYILLFFTRDYVPVFIGSLLMMCGFLSGNAVFGAVIRDNTPENKAGMFQGLRIVGQVLIPGIVGPAIGALVLSGAEKEVIDGVSTFIPNANIFMGALIVALVLCLLLVGAIFLVRHISKKSSEEGK